MLSILIHITLTLFSAGPTTQPAVEPSKPVDPVLADRARRYRQQAAIQCTRKILELEDAIEWHQARIAQLRKDKRLTHAKRRECVRPHAESIRTYRKTISTLEENGWAYVPSIWGNDGLIVGDVGTLNDDSVCVVSQVIDGENMLVVRHYTVQVERYGEYVEVRRESDPFWVKGVSTSKLHDNQGVGLGALYDVTGTKQYTTILGATRTVPVVEPWELSPEYLPKPPEEEKPNRRRAERTKRDK